MRKVPEVGYIRVAANKMSSCYSQHTQVGGIVREEKCLFALECILATVRQETLAPLRVLCEGKWQALSDNQSVR